MDKNKTATSFELQRDIENRKLRQPQKAWVFDIKEKCFIEEIRITGENK